MRFPLEIVETVRAVWPTDKPLFFRISAIDGIDGGWTLGDSVIFARALRERGVDVVDCSSGGLTGSATAARRPRNPGFQVPFAETIRREASIATMAVGLILDALQAEQVLQSGAADLVAIGREALYNPNWPLHAEGRSAPPVTSIPGRANTAGGSSSAPASWGNAERTSQRSARQSS